MEKSSVLCFLVILLSLSTVAFIGLFGWQYLKNQEKSTESDVCPYYPTPQNIDFSAEEFRDMFKWLDEYVSSSVNDDFRPSISANLVYQDRIVWTGYFGRVNKNTTRKPDENTIYRIASISKIFPVIFLFKLHEEGKLSIYEPVTKYAPDFKIGRPFGSTTEITLIDIASQMSGLPLSLPYEYSIAIPPNFWNGTLEEALEHLRDEVLVAEPRTICSYSNIAYPLLADILARNFTSDRNFTKWAKENVVDMIGMKNTGFHYNEDIISRMATGYLSSGMATTIYDMMYYGPSGNYYSTVGDLAKLSMSFLETSATILKHETIAEILRSRKTCEKRYFADYTGSPWEMFNVDSYKVVQKLGSLSGYSSGMTMVPGLKLSFNILSSGARKLNVGLGVMEKVIPVFRNALRKKDRMINPTPDPEKYTGYFSLRNQVYLNVTTDGSGHLFAENTAFPIERTFGLSYIAEGTFSALILGGEYRCMFDSVNLGELDGSIFHFKEFKRHSYHVIDLPAMGMFGFQRVH